MPDFGFVGPSYQARSIAVDGEQAVNLFCELVESGQGASKATRWTLYKVPGKLLFCALPQSPVTCVVSSQEAFNGFSGTAGAVPAFFALAGNSLYSIEVAFNPALPAPACFSGVPTQIATGFTDASLPGGQFAPTQILVLSPNLLFVVAGGVAYVVAYGTQGAAFALNSGGQGYAVGDTGIILGFSGASAMYQILSVSTPAIGAILDVTATPNVGGTGYAVGDAGTIGGGSGATYVVDSVLFGGIVWTWHLTAFGSGYSVVTNVSTSATSGSGTGFTIDIVAVTTGTQGKVTSFTLLNNGTGYVIQNGAQTQNAGAQPGVGEGLTFNVTAVNAAQWAQFAQTIPNGG